ncbi:MAG: type II toxin-antitoxin system HicB family antitoxin [Candidatus Poribacteria bacterium]
MKRRLTARVWQEDDVYVAQCVEIDVASQGYSETDALDMLKEAVELCLADPHPGTILSDVETFDLEISAA